MACFLAPLAEAVASTVVRRRNAKAIGSKDSSVFVQEIPTLEKMLWGGSIMLIVDHIINGEVMFRYPFFSALAVEGGAGTMLREIVTVGLPMAAVITAVWAVYAVLKSRKARA